MVYPNNEKGPAPGAPFNAGTHQGKPLARDFPAEVDRTESGSLICPVCSSNHAHLGQSVGQYTADSRAYGWAIPIEGECGHAYTLVVRQHKGQVQLFTVPQGIDL